jgi:hypothetical protein
MLINVASLLFAVGLMAFVFGYGHRKLERWNVSFFTVNTSGQWALRFVALALLVGGGTLFSYSLRAPITYLIPSNSLREPVEDWLSLMDGANYEDAWNKSAQGLKHSLSAAEFIALAKQTRKPLGSVMDRYQVTSIELSTLPDGREGIFQLRIFRTTFESGVELEETVVVESEDNQWKILNYNIDDARE